MKPQREFVSERPVARHCPELLSSGPSQADLLRQFAQLGERLAARFGHALERMGGGERPQVCALPPRECTMGQLAEMIPPLAANSLLAAGSAGLRLLASIDAAAMFRLLDRAFGGTGAVPDPLPDTFPLSADLFAQRLESALGDALAQTLGEAGVAAPRRDASLAALHPFPAETPLAALTLEVAEADGETWAVTLAIPLAALPTLPAVGGRPERAVGAPSRPLDPASAPFADIPLGLSAVLVDMAIPFQRLSTLRPGDVLPVAVARAVPVRAGEITVATGTVGTLDDRIAIQITRAL